MRFLFFPRISGRALAAVSMVLIFFFSPAGHASGLPAAPTGLINGKNVSRLYSEVNSKNLSTGERIAWFARRFIGTPYDRDPLGEYVTRKTIVADDNVDCMYHVFRSVELALAGTPAGAERLALIMRFRDVGRLSPNGEVLNYDDRYQYGLDMVLSGKWGKNITGSLGKTETVPASPRFAKEGVSSVQVLPKKEIGQALRKTLFKSGDLVFFVKDPARRVVGEVIGHMGILAAQGGQIWLIHAHGTKKMGGAVAQTRFGDYARSMPFIGIIVTRLD